jgi:hypothetical protein
MNTNIVLSTFLFFLLMKPEKSPMHAYTFPNTDYSPITYSMISDNLTVPSDSTPPIAYKTIITVDTNYEGISLEATGYQNERKNIERIIQVQETYFTKKLSEKQLIWLWFHFYIK